MPNWPWQASYFVDAACEQLSVEAPAEKRGNFPRLEKVFLIRVVESNRNIYTFFYPMHVSSVLCSDAIATVRASAWKKKIEHSCPELDFEGITINLIPWNMSYIYELAPYRRPKDEQCMYRSACQLAGNCATPLPSDSSCLVRRG